MAKRVKQDYVVSSRQVTIYNRKGQQIGGGKSLHTDWRDWIKYEVRYRNVLQAIKHIVNRLRKDHVGGIVAIRPMYQGRPVEDFVKIFQAKWGTNDLPFIRFDGNAGNYWALQIKQKDPAYYRQLRDIVS